MAQFSVIPDMEKISIFVKEVTGKLCEVDTTWTEWSTGNPDTIQACLTFFRTCYRPCHLKLLNELEEGNHSNPCALIRQLLRPHGLTVQYRNKVWKIIRKFKGGMIDDTETVVEWS